MMETYKDIQGYEGCYQVSDLGNIKSLARPSIHCDKNKTLKQVPNGFGYINVCLFKNGKRKYFLAHRLVAAAFIPNAENKDCVNHINGIKTDNRVENLEWSTPSENKIHSIKILKRRPATGMNHYLSHPICVVSVDGFLLNVYDSINEAIREKAISWKDYKKTKTDNYLGGFLWL